MSVIRLFACSMILFAGVAIAEPAPRSPSTFGDATFGEPVENLPGISQSTDGERITIGADDGLVEWTRSVTPGALPAGVSADAVRYDTWEGRLLRVRLITYDVNRAESLRDFATAVFGEGRTFARLTSWEHDVLVARFQEGEFWPSPKDEPAVLTIADRVLESEWAGQRELSLREAELAESRRWTGALSGVDVRFDPRLGLTMKSAIQKQSWGASLILWGTLLAGGSVAVVGLSDGEVPSYVLGTGGVGILAVIVGSVLSASASSDIDAITAPR